MRFLALVVSVFALILFVATIEANASPVAQEFVNGYNAGHITNFADDCEDKKLPCSEVYEEFLGKNKDAKISLTDVYYDDQRTIATFHANGLDGTMTMWTDDGRITRIEHENVVYPQLANYHIADLGQVADGVTTAVAISKGFVEGNPVRPDSVGGNMLFSGGIIGVRHLAKRYLPIGGCMYVSQVAGAAGWAGGTWNGLHALAGVAAPIAIPVAIIAGIAAYALPDYRAECLPGNYVKEIV